MYDANVLAIAVLAAGCAIFVGAIMALIVGGRG